MNDKTEEIRAVENRYGVYLFGMGLTHLFDVGVRNLTAEYKQTAIERIEQESMEAKAQGSHTAMSPSFQQSIIHCASDLAVFSIWELLTYVKKHIYIK